MVTPARPPHQEDADVWDELRAAIDALPTEQSRAMHMRYVEGMSEQEIAAALGVTAREVEVLINSALDALRPAMNPTLH